MEEGGAHRDKLHKAKTKYFNIKSQITTIHRFIIEKDQNHTPIILKGQIYSDNPTPTPRKIKKIEHRKEQLLYEWYSHAYN